MSTGKNYVQDITNRKCNPIVLELKAKNDSKEAMEYQKQIREGYESMGDFDLIYEQDTYEETLEMVKQYDPLLIIPGTEEGVILATKLSNDLNLPGNPIENLDAMTLKNEMQKRLAENNLRYIKGKTVSTIDEAIDFYEREGLNEVVIKPVYSAASVGVRICLNKDEMIKAVEEVLKQRGCYGNEFDEVLIQERIDGMEYVVNTVSCDGVHRITTIWKYHKAKTEEGGVIYDYDEIIADLGLGESQLVEYAFDVADAIGIKYGPVHGEYMVDENGPVLIEVNCRPMGGSFDSEFLDRISAQHETDSSLDSYLNPEKFHKKLNEGYKLFSYGVIKSLIVPKDLIAESSPIKYISSKLKSFYKISLHDYGDYQPFLKTQDLESSAGDIYLVHEDPNQVKKDVDYIRTLEKQAFQLVLSEGLNKNKLIRNDNDDLRLLLENIKSYESILLVTDEEIDELDILQVAPDKLDEIKGQFDYIIININKSIINKKDDYVAELFLNIFNKIRTGGYTFILKNTYDYLPNGRLGAEALVKIFDLKIQIPKHNLKKIVIASNV